MALETGGRAAYRRALNDVSKMLDRALRKLDAVGAPRDIGAHIDRAKCRIDEVNAK